MEFDNKYNILKYKYEDNNSNKKDNHDNQTKITHKNSFLIYDKQ